MNPIAIKRFEAIETKMKQCAELMRNIAESIEIIRIDFPDDELEIVCNFSDLCEKYGFDSSDFYKRSK